jgi:hypothetical protein
MSNKQQTAVEWQYIELSKFLNGKSEFTHKSDILIKAKEMEKEQQPIKVKAIQDDSYHWYVIPNELYDEFLIDEQNEDMIDSGEFDAKWDEYRTGGDLNLIQLYTYGGNK